MRSSKSFDLLEPDPEIERTIRRLLKEKKDREAIMAHPKKRKALRDYAVKSTSAATSCIIKLMIQASNFELRTRVIHLCKTHANLEEDPTKIQMSTSKASWTNVIHRSTMGFSPTQYD